MAGEYRASSTARRFAGAPAGIAVVSGIGSACLVGVPVLSEAHVDWATVAVVGVLLGGVFCRVGRFVGWDAGRWRMVGRGVLYGVVLWIFVWPMLVRLSGISVGVSGVDSSWPLLCGHALYGAILGGVYPAYVDRT